MTGNKKIREEGRMTGTVAKESSKINSYEDLRKLAFEIGSDDLGMSDLGENEVYAVISEMNVDGAVVTISAFINGETSMYISTGAVFIGTGQHADVKPVVKRFIAVSREFLSESKYIERPEKPELGTIIFNLKTGNGMHRISDSLERLESGESEFSDMFYALNDVITQIRLKSQK